MSAITPYVFVNSQLERISSSILAAKEYEGKGRIIHDSYNKSDYANRRHWFLGKHPVFESNPQLLPKVNREADQVFELQAEELSVEQVRNRELVLEVEPLLPLPTHTNTNTLDNFRSTGTKEWTAEVGHPIFSPSPERSPGLADTGIRTQDYGFLGVGRNAELELSESLSDAHVKTLTAGQILIPHPQTITAGPNPTQQTTTNMAAQMHPLSYTLNHHLDPSWPSAMDQQKDALNPPENSNVMQQIKSALGAPEGSLKPSDAPLQYQNPAQVHRPQHGVSSVMGRPIYTPVKPQSGFQRQKRAAAAELEDADNNASGEDQRTKRPTKRSRVAEKKPREIVTAGEELVDLAKPARRHVNQRPTLSLPAQDSADVGKPTRRPAAKQPREATTVAAGTVSKTTTEKIKAGTARATSSAASSLVSNAVLTADGSRRPALGGKSLPIPAADAATATADSRRPSHPACVIGTRMARSRKEAEEAAVERKQALLTDLLTRNPRARHPDLPPEFFDIANFTHDEKDPHGDGVVRCICGKNADDGTYLGDWIGCDSKDCNVWQHVPCMGAAVPVSATRKNDKYLCQQCDPFAHRRLIQTLRKAQPLPPA